MRQECGSLLCLRSAASCRFSDFRFSSLPSVQADEATTKLLSVPYGQKAVHGEYSPADKRWGLTRQSYEECAEFGKLYRKLGKLRQGATLQQLPADSKDTTTGKKAGAKKAVEK